MTLTLPELDDRRYADLVEEARGLLVTFAPALTNHNPSDPVVTLTELFAYFTEILLFRLNYVTDANRMVFLRLLNGPDWQPEEGIDAEVRRTVLRLRSVERAVTPADYELLARTAVPPGRIARSRCVPGFDLSKTDPVQRATARPDCVSVVIVPFVAAALPGLLTDVAAFLEPRRLLGTRVKIVGPRFVPVQVRVTVHLLPDATESVMRARVVDALTRFLQPVADSEGNGWPFGRDVHVSEIYRLLDTLPGVDFVTRTASGAVPPTTPATQDELSTAPGFSSRLVRNDAGELVSIALESDELVLPQISGDDIGIELFPSVA